MKVIYPISCGVDIHKTFLVTTLITSQGITPHYQKNAFNLSIIPYANTSSD